MDNERRAELRRQSRRLRRAYFWRPLGRLHAWRLGEEEAAKRSEALASLRFAAMNKEALIAPPVGWTGFELARFICDVIYARVDHFNREFERAGDNRWAFAGRKASFETERVGRDEQRAFWQSAAAEFARWQARHPQSTKRQSQSQSRQQNRARGPAQPKPDAYEQALRRLGLREPFDKAALNRAYKRAIIAAHPDRGGSDAAAQEVNTDRDLIRKQRGW